MISSMSACIFSQMGNELLLRMGKYLKRYPHPTLHLPQIYTKAEYYWGRQLPNLPGQVVMLCSFKCTSASYSQREKRNSQPLLKREVESCGLSPSFLVARWCRKGVLRPLWQDYSASPYALTSSSASLPRMCHGSLTILNSRVTFPSRVLFCGCLWQVEVWSEGGTWGSFSSL